MIYPLSGIRKEASFINSLRAGEKISKGIIDGVSRHAKKLWGNNLYKLQLSSVKRPDEIAEAIYNARRTRQAAKVAPKTKLPWESSWKWSRDGKNYILMRPEDIMRGGSKELGINLSRAQQKALMRGYRTTLNSNGLTYEVGAFGGLVEPHNMFNSGAAVARPVEEAVYKANPLKFDTL